tara:strand:+ start:428 stop:1561 length:1134 start_codon:yes stop_codon:yes gene_type:complete
VDAIVKNKYQRTLKPIQKRAGCHVTINTHSKIDFSSNDTLSLSTEPCLLDALNTIQFTQFGSTGSRLLSGDYDQIHHFESELAQWISKPRVLLFNSGFQLNSGLFNILLTDKDVLFIDKQCHASIIDGALASKATVYRYHHHDLEHLTQLLTKHRHQYTTAILVTESLFSMDGFRSDISQLIALKHEFKAQLYIDDAHSIGLHGNNGTGVCAPYLQDIDYFIATFGKAFGSFGAFLACNDATYTAVINRCRSFIYTTALPLPVVWWNQQALRWIQSHSKERDVVMQISKQFQNGLQRLNIPFTGNDHIISLLIKDDKKTLIVSKQLQDAGYYALPILPPTVPKNKSCIRFTFTRSHTPEMVNGVLTCIKTIYYSHVT